MKQQYDKWHKQWRCGEPLDDHMSNETFPVMLNHVTEEEVVYLAGKFKGRTCKPDGWHPRHLGLLPAKPTTILTLLIQLGLYAASVPERISHLDVLLQPKHKGGAGGP